METIKYVRPSVVLIKNNEVLVLKSQYHGEIFYVFPGGGINKFEAAKNAVVREAFEETNYHIRIVDLLYLQEWINDCRDKHVINLFFLGEIIKGSETHLNDPDLHQGHILKIEWIPVDKLHTVDFRPRELIPTLQADFRNKFEKRKIYLDYSV